MISSVTKIKCIKLVLKENLSVDTGPVSKMSAKHAFFFFLLFCLVV